MRHFWTVDALTEARTDSIPLLSRNTAEHFILFFETALEDDLIATNPVSRGSCMVCPDWASSSRPRETSYLETPAAAATNDVPPQPRARASANSRRRWRSLMELQATI